MHGQPQHSAKQATQKKGGAHSTHNFVEPELIGSCLLASVDVMTWPTWSEPIQKSVLKCRRRAFELLPVSRGRRAAETARWEHCSAGPVKPRSACVVRHGEPQQRHSRAGSLAERRKRHFLDSCKPHALAKVVHCSARSALPWVCTGTAWPAGEEAADAGK